MANREGITEDLAGLAEVASLLGQPERAARLLGAVETLREESGMSLPPLRRAEYDRIVGGHPRPPGRSDVYGGLGTGPCDAAGAGHRPGWKRRKMSSLAVDCAAGERGGSFVQSATWRPFVSAIPTAFATSRAASSNSAG